MIKIHFWGKYYSEFFFFFFKHAYTCILYEKKNKYTYCTCSFLLNSHICLRMPVCVYCDVCVCECVIVWWLYDKQNASFVFFFHKCRSNCRLFIHTNTFLMEQFFYSFVYLFRSCIVLYQLTSVCVRTQSKNIRKLDKVYQTPFCVV